ncbi:hypothetical protein [Fischerella sp. PCC 9605]|uniref:hypothetical protein n=1 Tax=Fischerella sp. PCC 9605 TaxID=1173024 RepID=UPI00047C2CD2|nr:hypothetical protein [Fischerella sp. PCC 9605]
MLKRLLIILTCAIVSVAAVTFFLWRQVTQLPSWYTNSSTNSLAIAPSTTANPLPQVDHTQIQQTRQQVLNKISKNLNSKTQGEVQLNAEEINALIISEVTRNTDKNQLAKAVKATNAQIQDGKISAGAMIDFKAIPQNELPSQEQAVLAQFFSKLPPTFKYQPFYIGIEGKPAVRNRQFSFDDSTQVKFGSLSFPLAELSRRLGIPTEQLNQQISQELNNLPIKIEDVEIVGDRVVVRSSATAQ